MNKESILSNVADLTADQLFDAIRNCIVTLSDLNSTGNLEISKKNKIKSMLQQLDILDDASWEKAKYGKESILIDYISNFPNGKYVDNAKQKIDNLEQQRIRANSEKIKILENLKKNPNYYPPFKIKEMLNESLTESDLLSCNIPQSAIDSLENFVIPQFNLGEPPSEIPSGFTEVYFWGFTGSGKTCALGAILKMAENKGYLNLVPSSGINYATKLKNIFSDDGKANDFLPKPTNMEESQYIPFTLRGQNDKEARSVSLIEISGEIFKCFFAVNAGEKFPSVSHDRTYNALSSFLKSSNRKIHFFFVDVNKDNVPDDDGYCQSDYLSSAANYFNKNNIFNKYTDAIYVVLTKSDLLKDEKNEFIPYPKRAKYAVEYLKGNNYSAFVNTLKNICKSNSINDGKLTVEPFSLGKVYFQKICDFEGTSAGEIVEILMKRIRPSKKSLFDFFNNVN